MEMLRCQVRVNTVLHLLVYTATLYWTLYSVYFVSYQNEFISAVFDYSYFHGNCCSEVSRLHISMSVFEKECVTLVFNMAARKRRTRQRSCFYFSRSPHEENAANKSLGLTAVENITKLKESCTHKQEKKNIDSRFLLLQGQVG